MVLHALQLQTPTASALSTSINRIADFNLDFFIWFIFGFVLFVILIDAVEQDCEVVHCRGVGEDAAFAVFRFGAHMDAYAFSVRYVLDERQQLLKLRRPRERDGVFAGGDDVIGVFEGGILEFCSPDGEAHDARYGFALRRLALERYGCHCSGF